jgi:hypothetical protein
LNGVFHCDSIIKFQVDNDDLVSLNGLNPETDFETEQLISEIELLTSRALQETHQWSGGHLVASPKRNPTILEANNNPPTAPSKAGWETVAH